jgi:hypothetical protein
LQVVPDEQDLQVQEAASGQEVLTPPKLHQFFYFKVLEMRKATSKLSNIALKCILQIYAAFSVALYVMYYGVERSLASLDSAVCPIKYISKASVLGPTAHARTKELVFCG